MYLRYDKMRLGMTQTTSSLPADKITQLVYFLEQANRLVRELDGEQFKHSIPKDQAWFWSKEWQVGEQAVDNELKNGDYDTFSSVDDLLADLDQHTQSSV